MRALAFQRGSSLFRVTQIRAGRSGVGFQNVPSVSSSSVTSPTYTPNQALDFAVNANQGYDFKGDLFVFPVFQVEGLSGDKPAQIQQLKSQISGIPYHIQEMVSAVLDDGHFKGEPNTDEVIRVFDKESGVKYLALVGLGPRKAKLDLSVLSAATLGRKVTKLARSTNALSVGVVLPKNTKESGITQVLLGIHDAAYQDYRFKKETEAVIEAKSKGFKEITFLGCENEEIVSSISLTGRLSRFIASGVDFAKDLVGAPPNSKTPIAIAEEARKLALLHNLSIKILGKKECESLNMGGYLGVQQGSKYPPQFIHLTYRPPTSDPSRLVKIALVGKGLTFDSGGYNLKAGAGSQIELMKFDMGGCAAVLGAAKVIAQLKPRDLEVHFISAVCENMVSSEAMKPGDILVTSNGKTIEVLNTDAEGRLTLADALVYAEKLEVDGIVDLATLTGACIVGLGSKIAGLYSNHENLQRSLEAAAKRSDEGLWPLPLDYVYKDSLKSRIADLSNISGGKGGGSITAALFLQEFVTTKTAWAHIDMAGPVWDHSPPGNGGPTGYGVKTLVDFLVNVKKETFSGSEP